MFSTADEMLKYIKDNDIEFIDVRFIDLPGVMQHFNMPASHFTADTIEEGLMFDGSSIRGFQAIHESDMKLMPDPTSAFLDPFRDAKTIVVIKVMPMIATVVRSRNRLVFIDCSV